ncbi:Toll-like receptor 10 [Lamellibrachia satsuma]|nr:Toll-like receptor 10 [Lamellibrachia satsuma]
MCFNFFSPGPDRADVEARVAGCGLGLKAWPVQGTIGYPPESSATRDRRNYICTRANVKNERNSAYSVGYAPTSSLEVSKTAMWLHIIACWCLCRLLCMELAGNAQATAMSPCRVTEDSSWMRGARVNCSHRRLTEVPLDLPANTTTLLLNNNDIGTLQQNAFCSLTELRHLDLSVNKLKSDKIAPDTFNALGLLLYLDISYNSLCMSNACFPQRLYRPLYSLKVFMVTGNTARDQRGPKEYPFRSLSVLQTLTELHISGIDHVDIPSDISLFKNLEVLDLYGGYMEIITAATFLALRDTNVTTLSLRSNNIELDLSRNFFKSVEKGTFANLSCLRTLKLNDNMFTRHLSLDLSRLRSLHLLDLSFNQMTSLSQDFRRVLDVLSERVHFNLDISGNPLVCHNCDSLNFLRWLRTTKVHVVARDDLRCADNPHSRVLRLSLDDVEALCAASGVSLLVVFTVTGGVGGCLLMLLLFLYVQRWRMRWYYYSLKRRWRQHGQSTDDVSDYKYGAVVVNADADLDWVAHDLVENVETDWALSLYISERDSPCGPIAENIVVSLETSRRVLFVLTPDFCDDNWCNFALNMALQRDQTSLVLLYVKPVQLDSTSSTLRALMSPRSECTLIEWGDGEHTQSLFWLRLHDTLLPTPETDMLLCDLAPCMQRPSAD